MCAEAFSNRIRQAEQQKLIHGLQFGRDLSISHLLFTDDNLIFTRATVEDCTILKRLFECYEKASGQIFNMEKSSMFLNSNIKSEQAATIKDIFQLNVVSKHEKYLGLPFMIGRRTKSFFNEIKLRVLSKISTWQHRFFSSGGKEILIKVVAQSVPTYAMSVFKILLGVCDDMQRAIAKFWWGSTEEKRSIHWSRSELLSQAKIK
ncbi:uncharacterized protein LOC107176611 [Citrus sinensis]|uniref:uncharacterized protein LOC107176611 n=1 Tax=Citrus sinensis TaxID=2711 RepID=UPI000763A87E|nr:uncharacterized protein LOC107176611 [Citrus sinensis]XP_024033493.1 uncharacterized protein LOC112095618 [Citrus x clementina]